MGGLFSRIKTWVGLETVKNQDLNGEFDNIIANMVPAKIDDYSVDVPQMQEVLNPGDVGTEVQATSLAEEIKELRSMIKQITAGAQWYSPPVTNLGSVDSLLNSLANFPHSRVSSGRIDANNQPMFLVPNGAAATVALKAGGGNPDFVADIAGTTRSFSADITSAALTTAPGTNNTCLVNDSTLAGVQSTKTLGENGTSIPIDTVGSEISSLNGKYAAFKIVHSAVSEYFIAEVDTSNNRLKNVQRGYFFDSADAYAPRVAVSDNDTITLLKVAWIFATYNSATPGIDFTYSIPTVSHDTPSGAISGDYWFDLANDTWKEHNGSSFQITNAVFIGSCASDTSNTIVARSSDFFKSFSDLNTITLEAGANAVRSIKRRSKASVYGNFINFEGAHPTWDMTTDLDSGETDSASVDYYLYLTDYGDRLISSVAPHDRRGDLLGFYHPAKPWRCVGQISNDSSAAFLASTLVYPGQVDSWCGEATNLTLVCAVSGNALTISMKNKLGNDPNQVDFCKIGFRSATAASGAFNTNKVVAATSIVISSGSTLGHVSAVEWPIYVYALDYLRTTELAVSTSPVDERYRQTTTVLAGSGADDSVSALYSTTARTNVPVRLIGVLKSTQGTAGTWAAVPTDVSGLSSASNLANLVARPSSTTVGIGGVAVSASSGNFSSTSGTATAVTNLSVTITTTGRPVKLILMADGVSVTSYVAVSASMTGNCNLDFCRGGTSIGGNSLLPPASVPPSSYSQVDPVAAGTYTYTVKVTSDGTRTFFVNYCKLVAYEI